MKNILLDTDIGPDCDDAAAIAILNLYKNAGLIDILGICSCTSNPYGAGTIDAICRYYGNSNISVGTYKKDGFLCDESTMKYNKYITENFPNRYKNQLPGDAVLLYRKALSSAADNSVDFISVGPLNNLSALLDSVPDSISDLSGRELIEKKVRRLFLMAGAFYYDNAEIMKRAETETGKTADCIEEYNVICDIESALNVASKWNTEKFYLGFESGLIKTGKLMQRYFDQSNPVREAYRLYTEDGSRFSWDPFTVYCAVEDRQKNFICSAPGTVTFDKSGRTVFSENKNGKDRFMKLVSSPLAAADIIDTIFINKYFNSPNG